MPTRKPSSAADELPFTEKVKPAGSASKRFTFALQARPGDRVLLWGSFNNWSQPYKSLSDKAGNGSFRCQCQLKPGRYEYKFQVNEEWLLDDANPNFVQNCFGSLNNLLEF